MPTLIKCVWCGEEFDLEDSLQSSNLLNSYSTIEDGKITSFWSIRHLVDSCNAINVITIEGEITKVTAEWSIND